jgi:hypothetical protein
MKMNKAPQRQMHHLQLFDNNRILPLSKGESATSGLSVDAEAVAPGGADEPPMGRCA